MLVRHEFLMNQSNRISCCTAVFRWFSQLTPPDFRAGWGLGLERSRDLEDKKTSILQAWRGEWHGMAWPAAVSTIKSDVYNYAILHALIHWYIYVYIYVIYTYTIIYIENTNVYIHCNTLHHMTWHCMPLQYMVLRYIHYIHYIHCIHYTHWNHYINYIRCIQYVQ